MQFEHKISQATNIYAKVIISIRIEAVKRLYDFFVTWDSHPNVMVRILSQKREEFPKNMLSMWHFLYYLPKVTDESCTFDKRGRKI